jgi:hypothetical protein
VRRQTNCLRENDFMRVVAVADPFKLRYPAIAIINMKIDHRLMRDVKKKDLANKKTLRFVRITIGGYDLIAEAWSQSTDEMLAYLGSNRSANLVPLGFGGRCRS